MSAMINYLLMFFLGLFGLFVIIEFIVFRAVRQFIIQITALVGVIILLRVTTNFPTNRIAFGGVSPVASIGIMFICTLLGIAGHHIFYMKGKFSWSPFLKPLVISPIVLLPLIGSIQAAPEIGAIQLISFGFLAFQNGFFWREVFEHAKTRL